MKVTIGSDLHLEFGDLDSKNTDNSDILILSGDVLVAISLYDVDEKFFAEKSIIYHKFLQKCCEQFKHVIYVMGNHESYDYYIDLTEKKLKSIFSYLKNLHILENESITIDDVTFIGGTMWTDMNNRDRFTLEHIQSLMNDFRIIKWNNNGFKFTPNDAADKFDTFKKFLVDNLNPSKKFVVVTHHSPSRKSTKEKYLAEFEMNGGYSSNLDQFIEDHPEIKLWTHGHTHDRFDYNIGKTRIVCNPRGYVGYEVNADYFEFKTVEI